MTDMDQALTNPERAFATPEAVCDAPSLGREEKIRILRRWEADARELEVAEEENMGGGPPDLLSGILAALDRLGAGDDAGGRGPPTKHGGA